VEKNLKNRKTVCSVMHQRKNKVVMFASKIRCMNIEGGGGGNRTPGSRGLGKDDSDE
jgi:hypothetical protein